MKDDEKRFLVDVYEGKAQFDLSPRDVINAPDFYMAPKRAWYLLDKWSRKGWYDYGVTLDLGWLESEGKRIAKQIRENMECTK